MFVLKLQEWIHRFEVGAGARLVRGLLLVFAFISVALLYNSFCFRNLATEEAMDAAQLARNIAEGRGFTTKVIRPFSMFLISRHRADKDPLIKEAHPDVVNAPVYPLVLAPVVKFTPKQDFTTGKYFSIAWSDLAIAIFNQVMLLIALVLVYRLAKWWFDQTVGLIAALLFGLTEIYWSFSISGLSTNFLIVLVLLLALCLARIEEAARAQAALGRMVFLAVVAGLLLGIIGLTRYSCAFLVVPAAVFAALSLTQRRALIIFLIVGVFALCVAPWAARNWMLTGAPFGVAGYAPMEQTRVFPEDRLERSLHPALGLMNTGEYMRKLVDNARDVVASEVPRMGGSWIWAFFVAGLLLRFRNPALSRMRWFVIVGIIVFIPVQALARTPAWSASPDVNSENLLVLMSPLVLIFGVGIFFVLLDSIDLPSLPARWAAWSTFAAVMSLPLLLALLPPHPSPVVEPPYFPPFIQKIGGWLEDRDLMMSDIPAAVAWYGRRQALATTAFGKEEFMEIHDYMKPIRGLYLTPATTRRKFLPTLVGMNKTGWENFLLEAMIKQEVPPGFPLKHANSSFLPFGQLLLMDYDRWRSSQKK